ncbi:MAG: phosphate signaling complex protein PhoU [Proteobacteria bacterium]|nr:phosphate signaling complex protein PhoU [Pseudomonadota bacterium]
MPRPKLHTDREYEQQLRELKENVLLMAGRVEEMIDSSVRALVQGDSELARRTIRSDRKVNRAELDIDELCMLLLAKRQPVASDLRRITFTLKMVTDLERIGDLGVNIAERALDLERLPRWPLYEGIVDMAAITRSMVKDAIDAFVQGNVDQAAAVIERDDKVDELYTHVFHEALELMRKEPATIQRGIHVQSVAKWLERVADHSTNLAEQVIFMVKGKDVRHPSLRRETR